MTIVNSASLLRTSREFPDESLYLLGRESNKAYIEVAQAVNVRTIGIYPTNRQAITGNKVFLTSTGQQTLRQVYTFTSTGNIPHGISNFNPSMMFNGYGSYNNGTNAFGVIYGSSVAIAGQVSFYVTSSNIVVQSGSGAPSITSGTIVIEWLSAP